MGTTLKALLGKRILITRPARASKQLSRTLESMGATTIEMPTIEIAEPTSYERVDQAIGNLKQYDWVIFTSVHGVRYFVDRMSNLSVSLEALRSVKVAAIGSTTRAALRLAGREPDFTPREYLSERLALEIGDVRGKKFLLPRSDMASERLPQLLRERGGLVDEVSMYRTIVPPKLSSKTLSDILQNGVDLVLFTSPSTVRNFVQNMNHDDLAFYLKKLKVACIGPITREAAETSGMEVRAMANTHTVDGLVEAIVNEIGNL